MQKHCSNFSVTSLTFERQHRRGSPGAAGPGALRSANASVSICPALQLCIQSTPNCICTLLCSSLLGASEFGPKYRLWAVGQVLDPGASWGVLYGGGLWSGSQEPACAAKV